MSQSQVVDTSGEGESTEGVNPDQSGQPVGAQPQGQEGQSSQEGQGTLLGNAPAPQQPSDSESEESGQAAGDANQVLHFIQDQELRQDPTLQSFKSVEDMAKSLVHAQKLVGKDRIPIPESGDDEAWNDVLKKLGRPDSAEDYQLPQLSEDSQAQLPEGTEEWFRQKSHELGLTQKQARDLYSSYLQDIAEKETERIQQSFEQQKEEAQKQLQREFGRAFEDKLTDARRALQTYGDEELTDLLERTGLGNEPSVIRTFSKLGESLREDKVGGTAKQFSRTPEQAKDEINSLMSDQQFLQTWRDPSKPGHNAAVTKMQTLYQEAYPETE